MPSPPRTVTEIPELDQELYPPVPSPAACEDQIRWFHYRSDIHPVSAVLLSIFMRAAAVDGKWRCISMTEMLAGIISVGDGNAAMYVNTLLDLHDLGKIEMVRLARERYFIPTPDFTRKSTRGTLVTAATSPSS